MPEEANEQVAWARHVCQVLREGISEEALEILEKEFGYGLPVFEWEMDGRGRKVRETYSPEERMQRAIHADGAHKVIAFIRHYRTAFDEKHNQR